MMGTVYLVGAGPGDPDLLTVKALGAIQAADVVLHDRLVGDGVLDLIPKGVQTIPVGKTAGTQDETQRRILWLMVAHARQGRTVVRLKGGDPFIFGRGSEEWEYLSGYHIPVEVVPGITSALAAPALAGIPLTHRGVASSFAVVTGHLADGPTDQWTDYAHIDTLVVLMGAAHRSRIAVSLMAAGRPPDQPAAFIERATTSQERVIVTTLEGIASGYVEVEPPAVLVVGDVVAIRQLLQVSEPYARLSPPAPPLSAPIA
jgi:uroporphyrin-III C-methyltransferase